MPLSHAVIKSALARNANKKKKNGGGLTAKNTAMPNINLSDKDKKDIFKASKDASVFNNPMLNKKNPTLDAIKKMIGKRMGGKVSTATQGNAPRQNTAYKQKTKRAAPSNPSGSERTKKSSGVNFIIAKKKKAKSNQLPKYRS
jgi:hypothetical protein|tara:strand:- start:1400 stop:1828 length:429 start_codon:yes stop_codon:yes gene_type:complete